MYNPAHPGEVINELCIKPLGLTTTQAAKMLGVTRKTLSKLLNCHVGVSPEMAVRLSIVFNAFAESWLRGQMKYDLWHAEQKRKELESALVPYKLAAQRTETMT